MMRKRLISVCIVAISVFGICSCARIVEDTIAAETATVGTENTETESEEETDIEDAETEGGEEADIEEPTSSQVMGVSVLLELERRC